MTLDLSFGLGGITTEELSQIMSEAIDKYFKTSHFGLKLEYPKEKNANQRLAGLEHEAQQPRLAMEEDKETDKKTRKRMEGATAADRAKHIGIALLQGGSMKAR